MTEFPSTSNQVKNFTKFIQDAIMEAVSGNDIFVSEEVKQQRFDTCKSCEHFDSNEIRCKQCGCFLEHKASFSAAKCPIELW